MKLRSLICVSAVAAASAAFALNGGNTFARLKVTSDLSNSIIAIPLAGCGEAEAKIYVTNLVMTTGLSTDDTLMYNDGTNWYAWEIKDGAWSPVAAGTKNGVTIAAPNAYKMDCGRACWLIRSSTSNPVYLYGQVNATKPAGNVALPSGTVSAPSYTLVGNPAENAALDLYSWKGKAFMTAGDMVIVPSALGSGQKTYRYNGTDWTVMTTTETDVKNPFTGQITTRQNVSYTAIADSGTEKIAAGCGFLYGCVASGKTLVWD